MIKAGFRGGQEGPLRALKKTKLIVVEVFIWVVYYKEKRPQYVISSRAAKYVGSAVCMMYVMTFELTYWLFVFGSLLVG